MVPGGNPASPAACSGWKWVVVRKSFGLLGPVSGYAGDGCAVFRAQAGIDDQSGAAADHDRDVGEAHDRPDVVGDLDGVFTDHRLVHLG